MTPDAYVFDLDGTLVDSVGGIEAAVRHAVREAAPDRLADLPPLRPLIGPPLAAILTAALPDLPPAAHAAALAAFRTAYDDWGWRQTVPYPGVPETLGRLADAGTALFVATNKPGRPTRAILAHLGLADRFRRVACPDDRAPAFADKAELVAALVADERLDPARTLLVGDSADDRRAAGASRLHFRAAAYGYGRAADGLPPAGVLAAFPDLLVTPPR